MKKYKSTQELVNVFPPWSRLREDHSIGFQYLNTLAGSMDKMTKSLVDQSKNNFLVTSNLDEIDLIYKVFLPTTFDFDEDNADPLVFCPISPTVSGLVDTIWYPVTVSGDNNVEDFWYNSVPSRVTLGAVVSGVVDDIASFTISSSPFEVSGIEHHLNAGTLWIETDGGTQYLTIEEGDLKRGRIQITGTTRKGTDETETIIFPWDMKQSSNKEWKTIDTFRVFNLEDTVTVTIKSSDFNNGPYIDFYNHSYSDGRRKVDEFWDLETVSGMAQLNYIKYVSDEWEQLTLGFFEKETRESWLLLNESSLTTVPVDMALQPFTERAWTVTASGMLYCYDLFRDMPDTSLTKDRTQGSHVIFEFDTDKVVIGEEIVLSPWHARPIKEIQDYRIWYQTPSGQKFGLLRNIPVPFDSSFLIKNEQLLARTVETDVRVTALERGTYLFVIEATFIDGEEHTEMKVVSSQSKLPLTAIDISSLVPTPITGIDFDSDQQMWVKNSSNHVYRIDLHTDVMTVDYDRKVLYFKEDYDQVKVITNG